MYFSRCTNTHTTRVCMGTNTQTHFLLLTLASVHTRAVCFIIAKWRFFKRPNQCLNAVLGTANGSGAQPQCLVWIDKIRISFFLWSVMLWWSCVCKILSNLTCLPAMLQTLPTALRWQREGNRWRNEYCYGHCKKAMGVWGWGGWLGWGLSGIDGGKKEERCISGPEIAVVYSSTNPKFCADPTVARKQLTVKWGGSKGLVCPVWAQTVTLPLLPLPAF